MQVDLELQLESEEFPKLLADEDRSRRSGIAPGYFAISNTKMYVSSCLLIGGGSDWCVIAIRTAEPVETWYCFLVMLELKRSGLGLLLFYPNCVEYCARITCTLSSNVII